MLKYLSVLCNWDNSVKRYRKEPFFIGDKSFSMNGFCLIRVDGKYGFDGLKEDTPSMSDFDFESIYKAEKEAIVPRKEIFANYSFCGLCNGNGEVNYKRKPCKNCGESGYVECECCGNEKMCPACEGDGWTAEYTESMHPCEHCHKTGVDYDYRSINVGGHKLNPQLLIKLDNELPLFRIMVDSCPIGGGVGFKFEYGDGVIMTMKN